MLGSEKYPVESFYKKHVSASGGASNASTSMLQTTFRFEVVDNALESTLDILVSETHAPRSIIYIKKDYPPAFHNEKGGERERGSTCVC